MGGSGLVLFEGFAGRSDFFSVGREDDALDCVFGARIDERGFAEVGHRDLKVVGHAVGGAGVDFALVEGLQDKEEIGLDGGAVLGEDEGQGFVDAVVFGGGPDFVEDGFDLPVMAAEVGAGDGGRFAPAVVVEDVTAKMDHGTPSPGVKCYVIAKVEVS